MLIPFDGNPKRKRTYGSVVYHMVNAGREDKTQEEKDQEEIYVVGMGYITRGEFKKRAQEIRQRRATK